MTEKIQPKIKRVLFYTSTPRIFRTTFIGHLYEISQVYPVVLLSEKLDPETEKILNNKALFPKIEEIIPVRQYTERKIGLLAKNRYLYKLAKNIIWSYKPDIIITDNDMCSFELYLLRFAKKIKAINICFQGAFMGGKMEQAALRINLVTAYLKMPFFLPFRFKLLLEKIRRRLAHLLYYWIMSLTVGQAPFIGKSSVKLWNCNVGFRDADYYVVFSKRDYNFRINDGIPAEKLYILSHPLSRDTRAFFEKAYLRKSKKIRMIKKF